MSRRQLNYTAATFRVVDVDRPRELNALAATAARLGADFLQRGYPATAAEFFKSAQNYAQLAARLEHRATANTEPPQDEASIDMQIAQGLAQQAYALSIERDPLAPRLAQRALSMLGANVSRLPPEALVQLHNLIGSVFYAFNRMVEAFSQYSKAEKAALKIAEQERRNMLWCTLYNLVQTAKALQNDELNRVLDALATLAMFEDNTMTDLDVRIKAADVLAKNGRLEQARAIYRRVLCIADDISRGANEQIEKHTVFPTLNALVTVCHDLGKLSEAGVFVERLFGFIQQYHLVPSALVSLQYVSVNSPESTIMQLNNPDGSPYSADEDNGGVDVFQRNTPTSLEDFRVTADTPMN